MGAIRAIETSYKGYRFRSRLEARWAVFFDHMGYNWKYEHQGYESQGFRYLPDFELHFENGDIFYVEVKGDLKTRDCDKIVAICDFGSPLPTFDECFEHEKSGLILLGDVPYTEDCSTVLHPVITHHEGLHIRYAVMHSDGVGFIEKYGLFQNLFDCKAIECVHSDYSKWTIEPCVIPMGKYHYAKMKAAYQAARSARFEHGEQG